MFTVAKPMSARRRGFAHERDLARKLWAKGFAVMRAPASGSKAKRLRYPDLVAIRNRVVFAFEIKTTSNASRDIYIEKEQIEKLIEFSKRAGGEAFIAVKVVGEGEWYFIPVSELVVTPGGNYKITLREESRSRFLRIDNLVSLALGVKTLREFLEK
ncbi:Holliday junction resolvase Hjc [Thermogladius sp. 4427co]|uniref:Holliday junction resolvase Hjc n=1 Tax=Thermogladius sp. 4427co TaxID=3450718 RepID=UPI003F7AC927